MWTQSWSLDLAAWERGQLRTSVSLKISPFDFERTIELQGNEVRLSYQLNNRAPSEELYLWAMHPLLRLHKGDQLELPASTRALLNGAPWLDALSLTRAKRDCEKLFASPLSEGWASIYNPKTGDRLQFEWDVAENGTLGAWLNQGGWHGHHHFALEPANGEPDSLTTAAEGNRCGVIPGHSSVTWQVCIRIGN